MPSEKKLGSRVILEGVRRVTWDTGEMCEFASSLVSGLKYMGEDVSYHYVMGTSGVAFRFIIDPGKWNYGNYGILGMAKDEYEPIRRAFDSVGYRYSIHAKSTADEDGALIMDSIDRGVPVIAFGVVGPSDCSIITGYDDNGKVLLGWSTYQNIPDDHDIPHDSTGYFRKPGWHDNLRKAGFILIGEKMQRRPSRKIQVDALRWAVGVVRTPKVYDRYSGLEAYKVWADEMVQDRYFPKDNKAEIGQKYLSVLCNLMMLDDRKSAVEFLKLVAKDESDLAEGLHVAIKCYEEICKMKNDLTNLVKDDFSEEAQRRIADHEIRRQYAVIIMRIRDKEEEAIGHIENLVSHT